MLTNQTPNFLFAFAIQFASFCSTHASLLSSTTPSPPHPSPKKMDDSDLFDGAIGIDLGTTYSYVTVLALALHLSRLAQLCGCMAK